jgi:hypothetical protein
LLGAIAAALGGELTAQAADLSGNPVELVLDPVEPLRERTQAALEALDVAGRGQIERRHRRLLSLESFLASAKGGSDRALQHLAIEQRLGELADGLLAARPQAVLVVVLEAHRGHLRDSLATDLKQVINRPIRRG